MKKILTASVVIALVLTACGSQPDLAAPQGLDGSWQLVTGTTAAGPLDLIDSHPVTLVIDAERVSGTAACNSYGGELSVDGTALSVSNLSQTEMACEPMTTMDLERDYLSALASSNAIALDGDELVITGPESELRFTSLQPPPAADLLGSVWALESLVTGEVATSAIGDPTLEFYSDGSFIATTGCRNLTGTYVESGPEIQTTDMKAQGECTADLQGQDSHIISVLEGGYRVEIDGATLTLTVAGEEGLVYRLAQTG
ncbi:MAG: META domain-containing protein [Acidimicrobiia bacterium]|nr:META domain-containing protein [Acidimicrobiia bacterium]MDH3462844.1 META domain-containing protein [Acidimicrobiia bacterium]